MKIVLPLLMATLCCFMPTKSVFASLEAVKGQLLSNLKSFQGKSIKRQQDKITHLVFIDVWRAYSGEGDDKVVAALPQNYLQQSQQIWVQPEINVTKAQLAEFQQYLTHISPLVLDTKFDLMRSLKVWSSPYHVLLKNDKQLFAGNAAALTDFVIKQYAPTEEKIAYQKNLSSSENVTKVIKVQANKESRIKTAHKPNKPLAGDVAPHFSAKTLLGEKVSLTTSLNKLKKNQPFNLVFLDALCPMPQFPDCEQKIAQLNKLIKEDSSQQWLGVVNSYYVNEDYVRSFVENFGLKLPILFDNNNTIYRAYDVYASPYFVKVDQQGKIISRSDQVR